MKILITNSYCILGDKDLNLPWLTIFIMCIMLIPPGRNILFLIISIWCAWSIVFHTFLMTGVFVLLMMIFIVRRIMCTHFVGWEIINYKKKSPVFSKKLSLWQQYKSLFISLKVLTTCTLWNAQLKNKWVLNICLFFFLQILWYECWIFMKKCNKQWILFILLS